MFSAKRQLWASFIGGIHAPVKKSNPEAFTDLEMHHNYIWVYFLPAADPR